LRRAVWALAILIIPTARSWSETSTLLPPPRTIADIAAILEQEKPDAERFAKLRASAIAQPPGAGDQQALARFYFQRAGSREALGRIAEAASDVQLAVKIGDENGMNTLPYQQRLADIYGWSGDRKQSNEIFRAIEERVRKEEFPPILFNVTRWIGINLIQLGDLDQAEITLKRNQDYLAQAEKGPGWDTNPFRVLIEANVAFGNAALAMARGQFHDAASGFLSAGNFYREALAKYPGAPPPALEQVGDWTVARAAEAMAREGRLTEAEAEVRLAIVDWLKLGGKYNLSSARILLTFTVILVDQGRYAEAETLIRNVLDIYETLGVGHHSDYYVMCLNQLASILALQGRWTDAAAVYAQLDVSLKGFEQSDFALDVMRIFTSYHADQIAAGVAVAERLVERQAVRFGTEHPETALARGMLAMGLFRSGHDVEALREFQAAIPILVANSREVQGQDEDAVGAATREQLTQGVIETYMAFLVRKGDNAAETFRLADGIRGHSVQKALAASAARAAAANPALAELARKEQDLEKRAGAQLGLLINVLALPPDQRDDRVIDDLRSQIERLQNERAAVQKQIEEKFPDYTTLIDPQPPTIEQVRAVLKPGEAFLSFYFGTQSSFVWVVPQKGDVVFASVPLRTDELNEKVRKLRVALEPEAGAMISEIPPFDLALAYDLYSRLLKPVEAGWRQAKNLIVVTNGALGELPLALLPTAPSKIDQEAKPPFAGYRRVPWLARTHAVIVVPSVSALVTLRRLPPGSPKRDELIGFGDPYFNAQEAAEAEDHAPAEAKQMASAADSESTVASRGIALKLRASPHTETLDSAELAMLPRLPDTRLELIAMARALDVDPAKALYLGKAANEQNVESLDLSRFRTVAFATHGLVAGDLNGLTQPALALTAPDIAGVKGNGLLTMEKILALKLDADWVVLSACNTAAGAGAGAEVASGLGSAFFYAGTRALLVTNWSVHSASARELVTGVFKRQSANPSLSRGEALRQSMMALLDGPGAVDGAGHTLFTYAHPLFWAPYTIIGDGG
jgi:CHAT domain-containing protein/tetratricopeptide (TPR) repeat protein